MLNNTYQAAIRRHPGSAFWQAQFWVWDAAAGKWKRKMQTTKCTSAARARIVAEEFQAFAIRAAGGADAGRMSREQVLDTLNHILTLAGHRPVVETRQWDEYSQDWLALQKDRVAPRSLESYAGHIRSLTRWLGDEKSTPLNVLDGATMQDWYFDMLDEGRKPATVNNAVKTLQAVFDRARAEGFCPRNPAELILRQYGGADIRQPFTADDLARLLAHLRLQSFTAKDAVHRSTSNSGLDWLTVVLLGICTGQRLSDCANADLADFEAPTRKNPRVWHLQQRKGGKLVHIPIVEPLESHLARLQTRPCGKLASSLAGLPTGGTGGLSEQFSAILDAAGIARLKREKIDGSKGQSFTDKTFHSLRHTTNSLLAESGVSDDVRRQILGHGSTAMNARYTHLRSQTLAAALKKAIGSTIH